jgi:proteasome accessory factor A
MSIPKAAGIETEYGIMTFGANTAGPFFASRLVLDAYQAVGSFAVPCSSGYALEQVQESDSMEPPSAQEEVIVAVEDGAQQTHPGATHRPPSSLSEHMQCSSVPPSPHVKHDLMLANGARFYIDHGHPEYSTAECLTPLLLVAADKAGERILAACQHYVNVTGKLPQDQSIRVYKNNSDYKHNSYGCHENYLLSAELYSNLLYRKTHLIFRCLLPFFISRVVLCGSGKVGSENDTALVGYQLSQRADFFETLIGLQTTYERPLFNTRDEPHADSARFRRLHVILGDANMAEYSTFLKVGTTQLVLRMLEDDFILDDLTLDDPLDAFLVVSRDLTFKQTLRLADGRQMTAVDFQEIYLQRAKQYLKQNCNGQEELDVLDKWEETLSKLPNRSLELATRLDWAAKKHLLDRYLHAQGVTWDDVAAWQAVIEVSDQLAVARGQAQSMGLAWEDYDRQRDIYFGLRRLSLEYHDIRQDPAVDDIGLFYRLQQRGAIERLLDDEEITRLVTQPPPDTRAWLRGQSIARFPHHLLSADWSILHFCLDNSNLFQLALPDPCVGKEADLVARWKHINNPAQLVHFD